MVHSANLDKPTLAQLEERETVMDKHLEVACSSQAGRILFLHVDNFSYAHCNNCNHWNSKRLGLPRGLSRQENGSKTMRLGLHIHTIETDHMTSK